VSTTASGPGERSHPRDVLLASMDDHFGRLDWSHGQIVAHQRTALRALLRQATGASPFHRDRLAGVDPDTFELTDLGRLPTMTKAELMDRFEDVVTDRRLTRDVVERHVATTGSDPTFLLDEYNVLASGGSSGLRGVFVRSREELVAYMACLMRGGFRRLFAFGDPPAEGVPMAVVAAGSAIHATRALPAIFTGWPNPITTVPVTQPVPQIVERLNALQPLVLLSYPSMLALLAAEKQAARLAITPLAVTATSEQLTPEAGALVSEAFGVPVVDQFGSSEGVVGASEPGDSAIVLASDHAIVELVDEDGEPVPPGVPSAKVLVTNLANHTQPLIRYELTDRFVRLPDAPDHGHLRVTVDSRGDDLLRYGDTVVHPLTMRSALLAEHGVLEYQVRQTATGADVFVVASEGSTVDTAAVGARLASALAVAGVPDPSVRVSQAVDLPRDLRTGKATRFVPLEIAAGGGGG
jgi:phenylacetate-CoA ligase